MLKIEIYPIGKVQPLTVIECDKWEITFEKTPRLKCIKNNAICGEFFLNSIAGFKELEVDGR